MKSFKVFSEEEKKQDQEKKKTETVKGKTKVVIYDEANTPTQ